MRVRTIADSSAAMGLSKRRGLGQVRRIELNQLWLQEEVINKEIEVSKVKGEDNIADALTKRLDQKNTCQRTQSTGQQVQGGMRELASVIG